MTKNKSVFKKLFFTFFLLFLTGFQSFSADSTTSWVIAAEKFKYSKGQAENVVTNATAEMLPASILEKLSQSLERNVFPDEKFERERYSLRTKRQSLYLQLSSAYKKRDSHVLYDYSDQVLKAKIKESEKEIADIKKQIDENLKEQKESQEKAENQMDEAQKELSTSDGKEKNEFELYKNLFKKIFVKDESIISQENVNLYQNDFTKLFKASDSASQAGYQSAIYEKEVYNAKINTLITGVISKYGDYFSVSVDLYLYPGAKKLGSIMEIGSMQDIDMVTSSIAGQLIPLLTNAMPVEVSIIINPPEAAASAKVFIDDVLQTSQNSRMVLQSGPHAIEFISDGYRQASTNYYFMGNTKYEIEIHFEKITDGYIQIEMIKPLQGDLFANGELAQQVTDKKSQIKINGSSILGEFVAENGETAFYYIPKKLYFDGSVAKINPKPRDREKYIDSRRRWLYTSYSMLIISLIPTFYTYGNFANQAKLYNDGIGNVTYEDAAKWQKATNIFQGISIGCGVFMGYELIRYLIAADSVLPQKAKKGKLSDFEYYDLNAGVENPGESAGENTGENPGESQENVLGEKNPPDSGVPLQVENSLQ